MIKRILTLAVLGAAFMSNTGCKNDGSFKKVNGVEYKIWKDAPGAPAKVGDIIAVHILAKVDTVVLGDTRKQNNNMPIERPVDSNYSKGQFENVFQYLSAGDSAEVHISCDTILKTLTEQQRQQQLPPWLTKGKTIKVTLVATSVQTKEEYKNEQKKKAEEQATKEDQAIQDYITKNNLNATKTASGMYYVITKEGTGPKAQPGQDVTMKYIGKTTEGKQFDANMDENYKMLDGKQDFTFLLGQHQVIQGWDEGIALLNKGARATLLIPSALAYGAQAMGPDMPGYSTLIFNVEVVDIKPHVAQAPPTQPQQ